MVVVVVVVVIVDVIETYRLCHLKEKFIGNWFEIMTSNLTSCCRYRFCVVVIVTNLIVVIFSSGRWVSE